MRRGLKVMHRPGARPHLGPHPWFEESARAATTRRSPTGMSGPIPRPDGTPPNNWLSDLRRARLAVGAAAAPVLPAQLPRQPARPELAASRRWPAMLGRGALLAGARRGRLPARCDQLRAPTTRALRTIRPTPPRRCAEGRGSRPDNPYALPAAPARQDSAREPAVPGAAARAARRAYPGHVLRSARSRIPERRFERMASYTARGRLHMAYSLRAAARGLLDREEALRGDCSPRWRRIEDGWPCWSFSNHDVVRRGYFLAGRNVRLVRHRRLALRLEHRLRAPGRPGRHRRGERRGRRAVRDPRLASSCCCWAGSSSRSTCAAASSRCRSSSSGATRRRPLVPGDHLDHRLRPDEDLRHHRGRRHRLRDADGDRLLDGRARRGRRHRASTRSSAACARCSTRT
jgi:hypothetical protein